MPPGDLLTRQCACGAIANVNVSDLLATCQQVAERFVATIGRAGQEPVDAVPCLVEVCAGALLVKKVMNALWLLKELANLIVGREHKDRNHAHTREVRRPLNGIAN